jgi:Flp pilus assembly protein CpaB
MAQGLRPGDRVDIYATYTSGAPHTEAVVGGAQVIAVSSASGDQFSSSDGAAGSFLEILVAADQASRLAYAEAFAKISLAVAGPDDPIPEQSPSVGVATPPP